MFSCSLYLFTNTNVKTTTCYLFLVFLYLCVVPGNLSDNMTSLFMKRHETKSTNYYLLIITYFSVVALI